MKIKHWVVEVLLHACKKSGKKRLYQETAEEGEDTREKELVSILF